MEIGYDNAEKSGNQKWVSLNASKKNNGVVYSKWTKHFGKARDQEFDFDHFELMAYTSASFCQRCTLEF